MVLLVKQKSALRPSQKSLNRESSAYDLYKTAPPGDKKFAVHGIKNGNFSSIMTFFVFLAFVTSNFISLRGV